MALLDVTQILTDPDLTDTFKVLRRQETVDNYGVSGLATQVFYPVIGVVTSVGPNNLDRHENYQSFTRSLSVVTKFPLRGETTGFQPDVIVWRGDNYVVKAVDPYPQFGPGFWQVECSSMDKTDAALDVVPLAPLSFSLAGNSGYIALM